MNYTTKDDTLKRLFCGFFLISFLTLPIFAQLPNGFTDVKVQSGYTSPMGVIFSKNGQKMFIWEKAGVLWTSNWNGTTYVKQTTPTLDLSEEVGNWRDFGLESVALDPNFDANGLIYFFYQVDRHHLLYFGTPQYDPTADEYFNATISRLTRYKVTTTNGVTTADMTSRKVLLGETKSTGVPTTHESHAGGQIIFGADGTLLVTTGDNASFDSADMGSASETYFQQAVNDGIMRPTENVGAFRSQLINSFCGKLLRLDPVTGDAIPSNPYYDAANPRSAKSCTWALGFRNPYRMSFKPGTGSTNRADGNPGTFIIGDVQNGTWEEIHVVEKGGVNCGWPLYEGIGPQYIFYDSGKINPEEPGNQTFASLCVRGGKANINNPIPSQRRFSHAAPAIDYSHTLNVARYPDYTRGNIEDPITIGTAGALATGTPFMGTCVTAGTFYTGTAFPANYRNVYFFADYSTNWIKAMSLHDNSDHQLHDVLDFAPAGYGNGIVDLEMNPLDESIFYVNINTGDIQKISFGLTNRPPVAVIKADKTSGVSPLAVNLSSAGSFDPDGNPITYDWDFGDGTANSTLPNPTHTFSSVGSKGFIVTLTVKDNQGLTDSKPLVISTNNTPPSVKITNPLNNSTYPLTGATPYTLQSTVTDNDATGMQYAWQVTLRHNTHEHREPINTQQSPTVLISPVGCDGNTYHYLIEVTVTDKGGLTAKDSVKIFPNCNSQNLAVTNVNAVGQTRAVAVSWSNPTITFDEVMVVAQPNTSFLTNPSGSTYTADANYTGNGTTFEGGKVVYRGTGSNITVTNLTVGTRYYFRVFTRRGIAWTGGVETSAVPTAPITQLGCLTASYFNNTTLSGTPTVIRGETSINNEYVYGGPSVQGIGVDTFSVRWDGVVVPPTSGAYTFTVTSDDGVRLWVNNVLVIDKWFDQSATNYEATVNLTQGQNVPIKMEYYEGDGRAFAKLFWTIPGQASQIAAFNACTGTIATTQLGCLKASYFNNIDLSGTPLAVRPESNINNEFVYAGPSVTGIGVDNFSVRWEGTVIPPTSGTYTFSVTADDGVRLWVNNVLLIDKWFDQSATTYTATINLTKDLNIPIKMEYYEGDGRAFAKLFWTIPNQVSQVVAFSPCSLTSLFDPNKCYTFTGRQSAKVMEIPNSALTNGAFIEQRTFVAGSKNQMWKIKANGDGTYRIMNANSGRVVTIENAATVAGTNAIQMDWTSGAHQSFNFSKNNEGYYKMLALHSGLPLEVKYSSLLDGGRIWQSSISGTAAQTFSIGEVGCPAGVVASSSANIFVAYGYRDGKKAVINWVSNANDNSDYFYVQKLNAQQGVFEKLAAFNAQSGTPNDKNFYTVEDTQPTEGDNIYRIALFRNGALLPQYSEIIVLDFSFLGDIMVFPNPSNEYVDIDLETVRYRSVDLQLLDASGKIVQQQKIASAPITPVRLSLDALPAGTYFIRIEAEGKREVVKKLIIAR
jgi:glucose/arabinose dehydrogenase